MAVCALLTIPNLRTVDASGKDLGCGVSRLGDEFSYVEMVVLPHYDPDSPYTTTVTLHFGGPK